MGHHHKQDVQRGQAAQEASFQKNKNNFHLPAVVGSGHINKHLEFPKLEGIYTGLLWKKLKEFKDRPLLYPGPQPLLILIV